jgi:hypothetical protein
MSHVCASSNGGAEIELELMYELVTGRVDEKGDIFKACVWRRPVEKELDREETILGSQTSRANPSRTPRASEVGRYFERRTSGLMIITFSFQNERGGRASGM